MPRIKVRIFFLVLLTLAGHTRAEQPIIGESHLTSRTAKEYAFIVDFTWSRAHGLKVLEFGQSHRGGSMLTGHADAYPNGPTVEELYQRAESDYLRRTGRQHLPSSEDFASQWMGRIVGDKAQSLLLYGAPGKPLSSVQPQTLLVNPHEARRTSQTRDELIAKIEALPTSDVVLKPAHATRSVMVHVVPKAALIAALRNPADTELRQWAYPDQTIIQPYYPSDLVPVHGRLYSPTGRIYFRTFQDADKIFLYPLTLYWKMHKDPYPASTRELTSENARVSEMDFGAPISPELQREILGAAVPFTLGVVRRMAELSRHTLAGESEIAEDLRAAYEALPESAKADPYVFGPFQTSYEAFRARCRMDALAAPSVPPAP